MKWFQHGEAIFMRDMTFTHFCMCLSYYTYAASNKETTSTPVYFPSKE